MNKAQRGQIAVLETVSTYTSRDYKTPSKAEFHLAQVLGVGRDGRIIRHRRLGDSFEYKSTPTKSLLVDKGSIDEGALISDMETKVKSQWDANCFEDLGAVKEYVKRFKLVTHNVVVETPLTAQQEYANGTD